MDQDQTNQTKQSSAGTMVLVAILMLLIGGAIGYYMTKTYYPTTVTETVEVPVVTNESSTTADETASWITYKNDDLSLKYPTNFVVKEEKISLEDAFGLLIEPNNLDKSEEFNTLNYKWIDVRKITSPTAVSNWKSNFTNNDAFTISNDTVGGKNATRAVSGAIYVTVEIDDYIIQFLLHSVDEEKVLIFDNILSTVKFNK